MAEPEQVIEHAVRGTGPVVVLLHPSGLDRRMWEDLSTCLGASFTVVEVDRRGHGDNPGPDRAAGVDVSSPAEFVALQDALRRDQHSEADELGDLLVSLGFGSVSTFGVLDGGLVGFELAAAGRVPVESVVMLDTVVRTGDADLDEILASGAQAGLDLNALAEIFPALLERKDPGPFVDWMMGQPGLVTTPAHVQARLRTMLTRNALSALLTTGAPLPGALPEQALAAVTSRVVCLRSQHRAGIVEDADRALRRSLPQAAVTIDSVPADTPYYPMTMPTDCCRLVSSYLPAPH